MSNEITSSLGMDVYNYVKKIPIGTVTTYKIIAQKTGTHPRVIGNILHHNPDPHTIPCHRIVTTRGKLANNYAFGGSEQQRQKLITEGVPFIGKYVDLSKALYLFE